MQCRLELSSCQITPFPSAFFSAAGLTLGHLVKITILLSDIGDFEAANAVYQACFDGVEAPLPARACYQVGALPLGAKVEIEGVAAVGAIKEIR